MTDVTAGAVVRSDSLPHRLRQNLFVRGAVGSWQGRTGIAAICLVLFIAFVGPALAPYSPNALVGQPFMPPSSQHLLGTDVLGRDALSRYLNGGASLVLVAAGATFLAYIVGIGVGLVAGFRRGRGVDLLTLGIADVLIALPAIVLLLILLAALGSGGAVVLVGIAVAFAPRIARLVRSVTIDIATQEYVEAAVARGEGTPTLLYREILPNMWTPLMADVGIRLTVAVLLVSSVSYLGLGPAPPAADWGLMISENRIGLTIQPWVCVVPALTIALLAIGVNLVGDAIARSAGQSVTSRDV
jgi:peptide/nickel transport system permease protein